MNPALSGGQPKYNGTVNRDTVQSQTRENFLSYDKSNKKEIRCNSPRVELFNKQVGRMVEM